MRNCSSAAGMAVPPAFSFMPPAFLLSLSLSVRNSSFLGWKKEWDHGPPVSAGKRVVTAVSELRRSVEDCAAGIVVPP